MEIVGLSRIHSVIQRGGQLTGPDIRSSWHGETVHKVDAILVHHLRKIARQFGRRGHSIGRGAYALHLSVPLIIGEEEKLLLFDRSPNRAAKLVLVVSTAKRI